MPRLTVWASLLHLGLGFTFGALMLFNRGVPVQTMLWRLLPAHIELLLLGWMAQLALGVAFWILPRFRGRRGNLPLAWASVGLLNIGVLLAGLGASFGASPLVVGAGHVLTAAAGLAFALHAWPRVKPPGA